MDMENKHKDRFCRNCGTALSATFIFCPGCGRSIGAGDAVAEKPVASDGSVPGGEKRLSPDAEMVMREFDMKFRKLKADMQNPLRNGIPFITRSPFSYIKDQRIVLWLTVSSFVIFFAMIVGSYYLIVRFFLPYIMSMQAID